MDNSKATQSNALVTGFCWLTIISGILLIPFGIYFMNKANTSGSWPVVSGKVLSTRVSYDLSSNTQMYNRRSYYYAVTYEYEVENRRYFNDRFSVAEDIRSPKRYSSEQEAEAAARASYPEAAPVNVYYDPENPAESVLLKGTTFTAYIPLLLGLFLIPAGVYLRRQAESRM